MKLKGQGGGASLSEVTSTSLAEFHPIFTRERVNQLFDLLELIVVRVTLLGLMILGAHALFGHHP
jgi:hypothetical protein